MPTSKPSPSRACAHCMTRFQVNPRVGKKHRYCSAPSCAKASHARSQASWLKKEGKTYHSGAANTARVTAWRANHPGYSKRSQKCALTAPTLAEALGAAALQDLSRGSLALLVGLVSRISPHALQDSIASEIRLLILEGNAVLRSLQKPAGKKAPRYPFRETNQGGQG